MRENTRKTGCGTTIPKSVWFVEHENLKRSENEQTITKLMASSLKGKENPQPKVTGINSFAA